MNRGSKNGALPGRLCRMALAPMATFALLAAAACGTTESPGAAPKTDDIGAVHQGEEICDGSTDLRLGYQLFSSGQVFAGGPFLSQNGFRYLVVDGGCNYWAYGTLSGQGGWAEVRTGTLSQEQAQGLAAELGYSTWASVDAGVETIHGPEIFLYGGEALLHLSSGSAFGPSKRLLELSTIASDWLDRLWNAGAPIAGPMMALVIQPPADETIAQSAAAWPLALSPADVALDWDAGAALDFDDAAGFLVSDPAEVEALRELRHELITRLASQIQDPFLPVSYEGEIYYLFVRDVIPLENPAGLIRAP